MVKLKDTTKVKSRTRKVGMAVTAAASVAGMVFAATPAAAAGSADFSVVYTASYYQGTATWSNRSVSVDGSFKASNCRRVYVRAFAGSTTLDFQSSSTWCNRSGPANFTLDANVVGGSDNIWVYMTTENPNTVLKAQTCYRAGYCVDGRV
ncbi:hypothetical protein [Streptomyces lavendofoliae]|uniref:Secreted protein n=1 Tax=Streptomyces lavendofoliae TaxID=67314 RepID=A0A918I4Q5_9ACTN|nr:hypothetical protein [Streptomyces lavendofoliae]GGU63729.1 hypothetical protein GCM10010274_60640 [Streptomyces lavendofoliae]